MEVKNSIIARGKKWMDIEYEETFCPGAKGQAVRLKLNRNRGERKTAGFTAH